MQWAATNISHIAVLVILFNHVKDSIRCLDHNVTLLNTPVFKVAGAYLIKKNTYLQYKNNDGAWVRSGKVTGRGFQVRNDEHLKNIKQRLPLPQFTYVIQGNVVCDQIQLVAKDSLSICLNLLMLVLKLQTNK